ncbi:hypothetical protein B0H13DRAFT_1889893 [Mycena leptocephala]|nr:hypothetical protein B0H13DRAFT_1889893 [Mycena leptocephala]
MHKNLGAKSGQNDDRTSTSSSHEKIFTENYSETNFVVILVVFGPRSSTLVNIYWVSLMIFPYLRLTYLSVEFPPHPKTIRQEMSEYHVEVRPSIVRHSSRNGIKSKSKSAAGVTLINENTQAPAGLLNTPSRYTSRTRLLWDSGSLMVSSRDELSRRRMGKSLEAEGKLCNLDPNAVTELGDLAESAFERSPDSGDLIDY